MSLPKKPVKLKNVYLDHAAATPLDGAAYKKMQSFLKNTYANPSALYSGAVSAKKGVDDARADIALVLQTQPDTIFFTGSGTESCNMAILGTMREAQKHVKNPHIITSSVEHHAVLHTIQQLEKEGVAVTYIDVNKDGMIDAKQCVSAITKNTVLISIMYANNEIGAIYPIADIGRAILTFRKENTSPYPYFHTDACQAGTELDLSVERLHVDALSLNASKIYGPKGVGMLYKRRGVKIVPLMQGGGQEFGLRPGTENVAGIVGFASALSYAQEKKSTVSTRIRMVRDYFFERLSSIKDVRLFGPALNRDRLMNNLNVAFLGVDAEALILYLDAYGISCASSSACTTDSDEVSHVLLACGVDDAQAKSAIRFTLGRETKKADVDYVMKYLPDIVETLRESSK